MKTSIAKHYAPRQGRGEMMDVHIIRADGTEEHIEHKGHIGNLIGAQCCDGFSLRDGRYVTLNDEGHALGLPINAKATTLYRGICKPGTTWQIRGDVAITKERK